MARPVNHIQNMAYLRSRGWIPTIFLAFYLLAQPAGCMPHRAPQKLNKAATIKSAPRAVNLVKQLPQISIDRQIYLPFMSQMQPANPPTHANSSPPAPDITLPGLNFSGIDFGNQKDWVRIKIYPADRRVNNGQPIVLKFLPGKHCIFGDHRACVAAFQRSGEAPVIWLTIHSGVGGEGQPFRNAIEGTGINRAAYSLQKTLTNLQDLSGSKVVISQGKTSVRGLSLLQTARIPGSMVQGYFDTPLEDTLNFSSQIAPELLPVSHPTQPILVFETCGWRIPGQPWFPGTNDTTASVYLGVIQPSP